MKKHHIPAIVIGSNECALAALRCLNRGRVKSHCLSPAPGFERRSVHYHGLPSCHMEVSGNRDASVKPYSSDWLFPILKRSILGRAVLMPCTDLAAEACAALPQKLAEAFPVSTNSLETVRRFTDKALFALLLKQVSIPHPATFLIDGVEQLMELLQGNGNRRYFLKPVDSAAFFKEYKRKAFLCDTPDQARQIYSTIRASGLDVVLQEYVPGPATNYRHVEGFVDRSGAVRALFARDRGRIYPPHFGNSTVMRSLDLGEVAPAVASLRKLLAAVDYRGIFSAEFKQHEEDGSFRLLEVNCRCWWYAEFAARCGLNIPYLAYLDALGEKLPEADTYPRGRRFVYLYYDFNAIREEYGLGLRALIEMVCTWTGASFFSFRWNDPFVALGALWKLAAARMRKLWPVKMFIPQRPPATGAVHSSLMGTGGES